jgi:catechol 2,3-dioxygenase-like lactoylglutathione lyase family enzyme
MRLDHIAYRVKDRPAAVKFFCEAFGYSVQDEFEITLEDGTKAKCQSLEPPEKIIPNMPFIGSDVIYDTELDVNGEPYTIEYLPEYHLAPEIFVSDGPPGSVIDNWVNTWGRGIGGIHHLAYQVDDVQKTMDEWKAKGWLFTTPAPLTCEDLTQVFTMPSLITGLIYEFIERKGQRGFCRDNVAKLMESTKDFNK